jgi:DNA-binding beta-propeller fold protein YncE
LNDATGDVYVVDRGNNRVDEFEGDGSFVRAWGWGVADGLPMFETCTLTCEAGLAGSGVGQLDSPEAIAVDNSGSALDPSKEDVYVTNPGSNVIDKFGPEGEVVGSISEGAGGVAFTRPYGLAVDPKGTVWVYDASPETFEGEIYSYSDALVNGFEAGHPSLKRWSAEPGLAVDAKDDLYAVYGPGHAARLTSSGSTLEEDLGGLEGVSAVAVDSSGDLYLNAGGVVDELSEAEPPVSVETFGELHPVNGAGIAVDTATGPVYVSDTAEDTVDVFTFGAPPKEAPKTEAAKEIAPKSAKLDGELNPGGATGKLEYRFDYNTGGSCTGGGSVPVPNGEVAEAKDAVVEAQATGLQPNAEYTYCLVALNPFGEVKGNEVPFKTEPAAPEIVGESTAVPVKATEATLQAQINPNNQETTYTFEYSTSKAEVLAGKGTPLAGPGPINGFNSSGEGASVETGGVLTQNTTYYYRVIAKNTSVPPEEVIGTVEHFTTALPPEAAAGVEANPVAGRTATLKGVLNPSNTGNPGTYEFLYKQSASDCEGGETSSGADTGATPQPVSAELTGLEPHTQYTFCLRVTNEAGESVTSPPVTFTTLAVTPEVSSESATQVTATSARLQAQLNPGGAATTYAFEYLTEAEFAGNGESWVGSHKVTAVPEPEGSAGSGIVAVPVSVLVEGLTPGTTYRYRLVGRNEMAPAGTSGEEKTFSTQAVPAPGSAGGLIDGRVDEMVSPPEKHGASLEMSTEEAGVIQASENGSAISYFAYAPIGTGIKGNRSFAYTQLLSSRTSPGVWGTQDIATRQENVQGLISDGDQSEYKLFSSDLTAGVLEPEGDTLLSEQATERTPYIRDDQTEKYLPLLPAAGLRPGIKFGGKEEEPQPVEQPGVGGGGFEGGVEFLTATPDMSHLLLESPVALTGEFKEGFQNSGAFESVYEWSAGAVRLASILPDGQPAAEAGLTSRVGAQSDDMRNALSSDGTRVVFESKFNGERKHLYLRDMALGQTVQLDVVEEGVANPGTEDPTFVDASVDGGRVFFLDTQRLTADASSGGTDLYMCEVVVVAGRLSCVLKDLTVALNAGESADVEGTDLGTDVTGTYIYFVASGVLAPGASAGSPNLYVQDTSTGETTLVAVLSDRDAPDWRAGTSGVPDDFEELTSRVSLDGRFVAFMSEESLTGYDNLDANSGLPDEEVFLYDRVADTLRCVSCNPSGARPRGVLDPGSSSVAQLPLLVDRPGVWSERWLAGSLPGWPLADTDEAGTVHALYMPRNLDDSGRLFFDSADGLVPGDANGKEDVYEYEPEGTGPEASRCGPSSTGSRSTYIPAHSYEAERHDGEKVKGEEGAGCVGLISSGTSNEESAFMDASGMGPKGSNEEEGEDVFFMTAAKLAKQDVDSAMDVYDSHTCSTAVPCAQETVDLPPACNTTDSCRTAPPPEPEVFGAPASATFHGPGNATPPAPAVVKPVVKKKAVKCARGKVRNKKGKCIPKPKPKKRRGKR